MSAQDLRAGHDNVLVQGDYIAAASPLERLPVFEVPLADRRWFWGRQHLLEELEKTWRSHATAALTQTLVGMGGVGKSQLAAQFAYRHREELELAWWVPCSAALGDGLTVRAALARDGLGPERIGGHSRLHRLRQSRSRPTMSTVVARQSAAWRWRRRRSVLRRSCP
jgi:hypothetical protein